MPDLISKKDAVIFLVDCNKLLFDPTENNEVRREIIIFMFFFEFLTFIIL